MKNIIGVILVFTSLNLLAKAQGGIENKYDKSNYESKFNLNSIFSVNCSRDTVVNGITKFQRAFFLNFPEYWFTNKAGSKLLINYSDDKTILEFKFKIIGTSTCDSYEFSGLASYMHQSANDGAAEMSWYSYTDELGCTLEFDFDMETYTIKVTASSCETSLGVSDCPLPEGAFN